MRDTIDLSPEFKALETQAMQLAFNLRHSSESRLRTSHTETMWRYRSYQGGEPASMIDWKQSAKGSKIYVREHETITHRDIYFWTDLAATPQIEQKVTLVLMALAHILVYKERRIGWLNENLPQTQTASMISGLFQNALNERKPIQIHNVHHAMIILAANLAAPPPNLVDTIRAYTAMGHRGLILDTGNTPQTNANDLTRMALNAAWPIVGMEPDQRADELLTHLLEKTVEATR